MLFNWANTVKNWLLHLSRKQKRTILQLSDSTMIILALVAAFSVRFGVFFIPREINDWVVFLSAPLFGVASLTYSGLYRRITRYVGHSGSRRILTGVSLTVLIWSLFVFLSGIDIITIRGIPPVCSCLVLGLLVLVYLDQQRSCQLVFERLQIENKSWFRKFGRSSRKTYFDMGI